LARVSFEEYPEIDSAGRKDAYGKLRLRILLMELLLLLRDGWCPGGKLSPANLNASQDIGIKKVICQPCVEKGPETYIVF